MGYDKRLIALGAVLCLVVGLRSMLLLLPGAKSSLRVVSSLVVPARERPPEEALLNARLHDGIP